MQILCVSTLFESSGFSIFIVSVYFIRVLLTWFPIHLLMHFKYFKVNKPTHLVIILAWSVSHWLVVLNLILSKFFPDFYFLYHRCTTTWTLTKRLEKKLDGNYTIMLRAILNRSWRQHPTKQHLYGHLPPPSRKLSELDEPDMQDTAGEVGASS